MLRPACCHSFISPNLTFPLHCDPTWNIVFVLALFVLSTNGAVHLLSNVMQLSNLCKSGLIYGAAVRKETRCHWVNAKLHFDKCHQCTVYARPQNHFCVYQRSGILTFSGTEQGSVHSNTRTQGGSETILLVSLGEFGGVWFNHS